MSLIAWNDEFTIGVTEVDYEHRRLIDLINDLHASLGDEGSQERIEDFLGELHAAISAHFALEEKLMREARYGAFDAHKGDHERLLDEIREIMESHWTGAYSDYENELAAHLKAWFTEHFRTMDAALQDFLGRRPGDPPHA